MGHIIALSKHGYLRFYHMSHSLSRYDSQRSSKSAYKTRSSLRQDSRLDVGRQSAISLTVVYLLFVENTVLYFLQKSQLFR